MTRACVFCQIVAGTAPAKVVHRWPEAVAIVPLGPVVDGHLLVIPTTHVQDALEDPAVTAAAVARAAEIAPHPCNLITSVGREATQSVFHLHWHIVPRVVDDGLALPWYSGRRSAKDRDCRVTRRNTRDAALPADPYIAASCRSGHCGSCDLGNIYHPCQHHCHVSQPEGPA